MNITVAWDAFVIKYTVEIYYIRYDISGIQGEQDWM